jgi:hypothetical protein
MGDVLLVTANESIDCPEDCGEQESVLSYLLYCEAVSAIHILTKRGSLLLKMFRMYVPYVSAVLFVHLRAGMQTSH